MILKKELTGARLKKSLGLEAARQRWHNKNKSGGNFGFDLYYEMPKLRGDNYELVGEYNTAGQVVSLKFSRSWEPGTRIPDIGNVDYDELIRIILDRMGQLRAMHKLEGR